jgi:hypothetical protein
MAYGVVLLALFVQAPSLGLLVKRLPLAETANRAP